MADEKEKAISKGQEPRVPEIEDELADMTFEEISGGGSKHANAHGYSSSDDSDSDGIN